MAFPGTGKIWMNGTLVDWKDATIHVGSHVVHYGSGVFEGARCYDTQARPACFRLDAHMRRLFDSARIYRMEPSVRPADADRRHPRPDPGQQVQGLLHPAADLSRLRLAGRQSAALPGRRGDHAVGMGRLLHEGSASRKGSTSRSRPGRATRRTRCPRWRRASRTTPTRSSSRWRRSPTATPKASRSTPTATQRGQRPERLHRPRRAHLYAAPRQLGAVPASRATP